MDDSFNLEEEYGGLLDLIESNIYEISSGPSAMHYGVKGMHWGVRKERDSSPRKTREPLKSLGPDSVTRKTKSGETITLKKVPPNKIHKFLDRVSKKYREGYSKQAMLDILDSSGKKVGDAHVEKRNDEELYLNWLGIDKSARGKGYATAVMQAGRDFGKEQGFKRMTLEVPGNSPDARHIYEKIGFKVTKEAEDSNDAWGGLTEMAYEFDASHSELVHYGVKGMHCGVPPSDDETREIIRRGSLIVNRILDSEESLIHYGVKGMHWGVRKDEETTGRDSSTLKWKKAHKPKKNLTPEQVKRNLAANEKKSLAKLESSDGKEPKQSFASKHKKTLIKAGVVAAAVGGLYLTGKALDARSIKSIEEHLGKSISADTFEDHVNFSKTKTWGRNNYIHESSWDREEFTLPAGHQFHRLSQAAETEFKGATYAVHSQQDFDRYVAQFRHELNPGKDGHHHISFQSNEEIKVPKLTTTLDSLKESLIGGKEEFRAWYTDERVLAKYQELSGGQWDDSHSEGLFDSLRKKGYGAIVDEMDAGVIGETPLVIFAKDLFGKKSSEALTEDAISLSESSLVELQKRKY